MMKRYRMVIIGNGTLASRGLEVLAPIADIPLVVADSRDDGLDTWRESFLRQARGLGYEEGKSVLQPKNPNSDEVLARISHLDPDIILSLQCRHIIRERLFTIPSLGTYNLHNAPLPFLRGCDPFAWAIHDGMKRMGVTLHQILDEGVDNGPIIKQKFWPIKHDDTAWSLYNRALDEALDLLKGVFTRKMSKPEDQDDVMSTYHPMGQFDYSETRIDWNMVADTLSAWIRARVFPPIQLPYFFFSANDRAEVLSCRKVSCSLKTPGLVASLSPLVISAKWGAIQIDKIQHNNKIMLGEEFAADFGFKVEQAL